MGTEGADDEGGGVKAPSPVLAAWRWPSNAELIRDVARMGYLHEDGLTLDPTFGRGTWWKVWAPRHLCFHDLKLDGVDFTDLPYPSRTFDQVAFDPPYVCVGGRETTTIPELHERYGIDSAPKTPAQLQDLICLGLDEMHRVVKPRGIVLVKCQDYISSGKLWLGTHHTLSFALNELGMECVDRLEMVTSPRPQPTTNVDGSPRRQVHARRNLSTLFVLRRREK